MAGLVGCFAAVGLLTFFLSRPPPSPPPPADGPSRAAPSTGDPITSGSDYAPPATIDALRQEEADLAARIVREYPSSANALYVQAMVFESEGSHLEAEKLWKRCLELNPRYAQAYERMGAAALNRGDGVNAEALFRKVLELEPKMPGGYDNLARALLQLGKLREAAAALKEEIVISPGSSQAHFHLGRAHLLLKEYKEAKESYGKAVELSPDYKFAWYGLAQACEKLGLPEEAEKCRKKFEALEEDYRDGERSMRRTHSDLAAMRRDVALTYINAGEVYRTEGDLAAAERHWKIAAILDPKNVQCLFRLAALYERTKRPDSALAAYDRLSALEPEKALHRFNAGNMHVLLRQFAEAETAYRRVVELAPGRADGYRALAQLYLYAKREPSKAVAMAREAVNLSPSAPNFFNLALAHRMGGDRAGSRAALEQALSLDPQNPQYQELYRALSAEETPR